MTGRPHYTKASSIPYREAGERLRLSYSRLIDGGASVRAFKLAGAVWTLTAGYSKGWDTVYVDGLVEMTGMDDRAVRRAIKECVELDALQWRPTRYNRRPSLIGLPTPGRSDPNSEADTGSDTGSERPPYLEPKTENGSLTGASPGREPVRGGKGRRCPRHPDRELFEGRCVLCEEAAYYAKHGYPMQ